MGIPAISTTKLTAAGNIKGSAGYLFWVIVENGNAAAQEVVFHNATSGTTGEVFRVMVPIKDTKFISFPIAMHFSTGIRCGTVGTTVVITGGYQ